MQLRVVMRGLDPHIHVIAGAASAGGKDVDGRNKSGHDDFWLVPIKTQQPAAVPRTALRFRGNDGLCVDTYGNFWASFETDDSLICSWPGSDPAIHGQQPRCRFPIG